MATQSVQKDLQGPDWPLGLIVSATPGTPVNIMSLVDSANVNAPQTPTPGTAGAGEYTVRAYGIIFQACKAGASHGLQANTGNIYICRAGVAGAGNRDDYGSIVAMLPSGTPNLPYPIFMLTAAALNRDTWSPYRYYIDADNVSDGALVTLIIQ
jgi:hypothetical protein